MSSKKDGTPIIPIQLVTPLQQWKDLGDITSSQATLAVGARDFTAVWTTLAIAKKVIWDVPEDITGCFFRFSTNANGDANTIEIWLAAHDTYADNSSGDHFMRGTEIALVGGTQTGPDSNVFVDQMTKTAGSGILNEGTVLDGGAADTERVAMYRVDLQGYKRVVVIAPTLANTLGVDVRGY